MGAIFSIKKENAVFFVAPDVLLGDLAERIGIHAIASSCIGRLEGMGAPEHRTEGLERQRALLRREVRAEEQHRESIDDRVDHAIMHSDGETATARFPARF